MSTQSALLYSFPFTHTFIQCIYKQPVLDVKGAILGFSILPKDTSACGMGKTGIEPATFRLEEDSRPTQVYIL